MPREIALAAEAQYVLSGSARASATRLRLTIELTDARTGLPVWSSGRDDALDDPLDAQRQAAEAIVGELASHIRRAELNRARLKGPDERDAYDLFLRARQSMHDFSRRSFDGAEELFDEVFERQPCYPEALAARAYWHMLRVGQGWSPDPGEDVARADDFVRRAIECAVPTASSFAVQGHVAAYLHKDFRAAFEAFDLALDIDPNTATAWMWRAAAHAYVGRGDRAVEAIERALALSPYDPMIYAFTSIASLACLAQGQTERAVGFARRSVAENRTYTTAYKLLVMSLGLAGRTAEAISAAEQLLTLEPDFSVALFRERSPTTASDLSVAYCKALASAGIAHS